MLKTGGFCVSVMSGAWDGGRLGWSSGAGGSWGMRILLSVHGQLHEAALGCLEEGLYQLFLRLGGQGVVQWGTQGQECLDCGGGSSCRSAGRQAPGQHSNGRLVDGGQSGKALRRGRTGASIRMQQTRMQTRMGLATDM